MPAVHNGRIYMAYPHSQGDRRHYLACFDLATGKEFWKKPIGGEIITAPVVADDHVYLATLDGTLWRFGENDGGLLWQEGKNATSSPVVRDSKCFFSQRQEMPLEMAGKQGYEQAEHLAARGLDAAAAMKVYRATSRKAAYLDHAKRARGSPQYACSESLDAGVGFAAAKGDAKIDQAMRNLGQAHVHGVWAYQGSKPFISRGRLYSALGDTLHCVDSQSEKPFWKKALWEGAGERELLDSELTPPAIVNDKLFVGSVRGDVFAVAALSGDVLWNVNVGEPVIFQPVVAGGRVYATTRAGSVFCLETGDPKDDGWLMWGATAAHNGLED
jgi:outer membrane protein assembly factor BamB